eukprot:TRINITY_DN1179_c0_g1_i10.p2 TRINITY_DN1179_c0_g1~~TRINITY_DN1179_c0_g1_i10.p2  ORF type:complete len:459 (+),score=149.12 TRINITY_DN1179_c0_g1_i10:67-1443(+)
MCIRDRWYQRRVHGESLQTQQRQSKMSSFKIALFLVLVASSYAAYQYNSSDIFLGEDHVPGFINIADGADLFYWLFRSRTRPESDPLVFWLTGGPGCSSVVALFSENGPFSVNATDITLILNKYSWSNTSNIVFVDQPRQTGFSKGGGYVINEGQIASDFYIFLTGFLDKHPEYKGREVFITGESYAGHYIPAISAYIVRQNNTNINFVGLAIGNGWVDPYTQYPQYAEFAFENNLLDKFTYTALQGAFKLCQILIATKLWPLAFYECNIAQSTILGNPQAPRFNVYDIRKKCDFPPLCYDFSPIDKFVARVDVREAIGVGDRSWESCNMVVHTFLLGDWLSSLQDDITYLLRQNISTLIYSGDKDYICNWRGGEAWTNEINWAYKDVFNRAKYIDWNVDGKNYGQYKQAEYLTFLRVYDAGHMVPMDQPEASLGMLNKFFHKWAAERRLKNTKLVVE